MFLTKIWILFLTFIIVVLFGSLLIAPRPAEYYLRHSYTGDAMLVDLAQATIDLEMKQESRQILDKMLYIRLDGRFVAVFSGKNKEYSKLIPVLNGFKKQFGFEELILVDKKGTVVAGTNSKRKSVRGYSVFKSALNGFASDNTILVDGKLMQIFGVPVLDKTKSKVVGALVGKRYFEKDYLKGLLDLIGHSATSKFDVEMSVFAGGKLLQTTQKHPLWSKIPALYNKFSKDIRDPQKGFSTTSTVKVGNEEFQVILGQLRGQATNPILPPNKNLPKFKDTKVFYALAWKLPPELGPFAFMDKLIPQQELLKGFPWVLFIVLGFIFAVLGFMLVMWEGDAPLKRFIKQSKAISEGELPLINDRDFRGKYSSLARAFNEALENTIKNVSPEAALQSKSIDDILGDVKEGKQLPTGAVPPPPIKGKPINYPAGKKVKLPGQSSESSSTPKQSSSTKLPPLPVGASSAKSSTLPKTMGKIVPIKDANGNVFSPPMPEDNPMPYFQAVAEAFKRLKFEVEESLEGYDETDFIEKLKISTDSIRQQKNCKQVEFQVFEHDGKAGLKAIPVKK